MNPSAAQVTVKHVLSKFRMAALPAERTQVILLLVTAITNQAVVVPLRTRACTTDHADSAIFAFPAIGWY